MNIVRVMGRLRNPRRERFAVEVASMVPVDRAYVLAGYRDSLWARPNGSRLAHQPEVAARIEELRGEFCKSAALSVEYLQALLLPVAEANVLDFFKTENGKLVPKPISELKREHTAALAAIKVNEAGALELKFHSKTEAINMLLRSIGAIVDRHDHFLVPGEPKCTDIELARWIAVKLEEGARQVEADSKQLAPPHVAA
jgi:hypothetical protein